MAYKPAVLKDASGTLSFPVPEGIPAATPQPTVTLYRSGTTVLHASQNASGAGTGTLSVAVDTTDTANLARNLRARWSYTVGATAYLRDQLFDVVSHILYPTLSAAKLADYWPDASDKLWVGRQDFSPQMRIAWEDYVLAAVRAYGKDPNRIMDPTPLEAPHACFSFGVVTRGMPGLKGESSEMWFKQAESLIERALGNCEWYDADQDLAPAKSEQDAPLISIRTSR